jgi:hypothetical protein
MAALHERVQPTVSGEIISALFGCVRNSGRRFHEGLDLAPVLPLKKGEAVDPVFSVMEGRVAHINETPGKSSYGRYVVIEHENQRPAVYSLYAHLARVSPDLKQGEWIASGTELGTMGRSAGGYAIPRSRAHLHFEIGLRLSDDFQRWYDQQDFGSANEHGNFNGMNLVGMDPVPVLMNSGNTSAVLGRIFQEIPVGAVFRVVTKQRPAIIDRCPAMELPRGDVAELAGWEITFSGWGLPLAFKALGKASLGPESDPGTVTLVALDPEVIGQYACRSLIDFSGGQPQPGTTAKTILSLLFQSAPGS